MPHASKSALQKRGDKFKRDAEKLRADLRAMRAQLDQRFCEGSANTMAEAYAAMGDSILCLWLSNKMMRSKKKKPPFNLPPDIEAKIRSEVAEILRKSGWTSQRIKQIAAEIEL